MRVFLPMVLLKTVAEKKLPVLLSDSVANGDDYIEVVECCLVLKKKFTQTCNI